jgi:hypothetical protein
MTIVRFASLAGLALAASALAGPITPDRVNAPSPKGAGPVPPSPEVMAFCENFDAYAVNSGINGQGGWEGWYGTGPTAPVIAGPSGSLSGPNCLRYDGAAFNDNVHRMDFTNGKFYATASVYMPASPPFGDEGYLIMCNYYDYPNSTATTWASQVKFSNVNSTVSNDAGGFLAAPTLPLVRDQWVQWEAMIDLVNNTLFDVYNGQLLTWEENITPGVRLKWTDNALNAPTSPGGSPAAIAIVDLYSNGVDGMLVDDWTVTCAADLDQSTGCGTLDIFDFLGFQNRYASGNPIACNWDTSTGPNVCDIFDFLGFQNDYAGGCP